MKSAKDDIISIRPIGVINCERTEPKDDFWGDVISKIELNGEEFTAESLAGLSDFSHIEIIYHFHKADPTSVIIHAEHPRENTRWPKVGIFAQRKRSRPNRLAVSVCELIRIDGLIIYVRALDAIDGTPVIDIKPVIKEFAPRGVLRQPDWITELMADYFKESGR